jgi:hypothetical protein
MPSRPSNIAEWGTGSAPIVEPTLAQKQAGWTSGFKPPAQWFNWWMNLVYQWIVWLNALETDPRTWQALGTFTSGAAFTRGAGLLPLLATATGNAPALKGVASSTAGSTGGRFEAATGGTSALTVAATGGALGLVATSATGAAIVGTGQFGVEGIAGAGAGTVAVTGQAAFATQFAGTFGGQVQINGTAVNGATPGSVGLTVQGGANDDGTLGDGAAADGLYVLGGDHLGDIANPTGIYAAGRGAYIKGGDVDPTNNAGDPNLGLEVMGGSAGSLVSGFSQRGATAIKATGGTGGGGRGLALEAIGDINVLGTALVYGAAQVSGVVRMTGGNLAASAPQVNQLSPGQIVKAWGRIHVSGGAPSVVSGQNCSGVGACTATGTYAGGWLRVALATPLSTTTRIVMGGSDGGTIVDVTEMLGSGYGGDDSHLIFQLLNRSIMLGRNLTTETVNFWFLVMGLQ